MLICLDSEFSKISLPAFCPSGHECQYKIQLTNWFVRQDIYTLFAWISLNEKLNNRHSLIHFKVHLLSIPGDPP